MTRGAERCPWFEADSKGKVFGIGLTKTGTRSLSLALEILGYKTKHYPWTLEEIDQYEAVTDIPVACRFRELDLLYPNSKFILTTRDFDDWIVTTGKKPADKFKPPLWKLDTRLRMYGSIHWDREAWTAAFHRHHAEVREYFSGRDNYLEIQLDETSKWDVLTTFLGKPVPDVPYPWLGKNINEPKRIL